MDAPVTYRGAVYPWHCDHIGHMNVMWYVGKFDEATWNFVAMLGFGATRMRAEEKGWAAVRAHGRACRPAAAPIDAVAAGRDRAGPRHAGAGRPGVLGSRPR